MSVIFDIGRLNTPPKQAQRIARLFRRLRTTQQYSAPSLRQ